VVAVSLVKGTLSLVGFTPGYTPPLLRS